MNINPSIGASSLPIGLPGFTQGISTGSNGFVQVMQKFIDDTNTQQLKADQSVELLATGQSDNVHETMLALTRADLSMRVFMEVRNKVIDAYQEVMRMQL
jgi:flagellar hook-basal body complex protein FliE